MLLGGGLQDSEQPEHYDIENASSIAPSDIDIIYHYKVKHKISNINFKYWDIFACKLRVEVDIGLIITKVSKVHTHVLIHLLKDFE